jgi:hypothetical protein
MTIWSHVFAKCCTSGDKCYQIYGMMRMSWLRQLPPQGTYVNADGVLLVRMSLLGWFYEVPEYLFLSRRHSWQSMQLSSPRETAAPVPPNKLVLQ